MLTTRGDLSDHDVIATEQHWDNQAHGVFSSSPDELLFAPPDWIDTEPALDVKRSALWRWRRRAAMVTTIAGTALAVVTFSLGSPISNYSLTSSNGAPPADDVATDDAGARSADAGSGETLSLPAIPVNSAEFLRLFSESGGGNGNLNLAGTIGTTTTTAPTTTTIGWSEPVIEPESDWVDAGHGVKVPDVLLRIRFCESTNNYQAAHVSSSARGAYQFLSGSWSWYGHAARYGVATADLATPAQQDEAAVTTLKKDGTRPWRASFRCWGSDSLKPGYATARPVTTTTVAASTTASTTGDESSTTTQGSTTSTSSQASTTATSTSTSSTASTTTTSSTTPASSSSTAAGG